MRTILADRPSSAQVARTRGTTFGSEGWSPCERARDNGLPALVSRERGSFTWFAMREYLIGGLGPGEGMAAVVPAVDEVLDGGDEVLDRGEAAAADGLAGDDRKEDLHHVEP